MTSAPAENSSSACLGVMPIPPEAFSPLSTTKSALNSVRRSSSIERITRRPVEPTTSPTKRIAVKRKTLVHRRAACAYLGHGGAPRHRRRRSRGAAARAGSGRSAGAGSARGGSDVRGRGAGTAGHDAAAGGFAGHDASAGGSAGHDASAGETADRGG